MVVDSETEWSLIVRCRRGSTAAFEPLVRAHEPRALAFARAMLGDEDEAADAVQDAFVKAYRSLAQLEEGHAFGPWFRSILRNRCIDLLRAPARRDRVSLDDPAVTQRSWTQPVGTVALEREQHAAQVTAALAQLSAEHREILVLKEIEELSYAEIARAMNIPPGTVASRLHHARLALRRVVLSAGIELNGAAP